MARRKLSDPKPLSTSSRLSSASKKAAQKVAEKLAAGKGETSSSTAATVNFPTVAFPANTSATNSTGNIAGTVPGLPNLTPDQVSGMLPKFDLSAYQISDPVTPP